MTTSGARLEITTAPFLESGLSTRRVMLEVLAGLVPVVAVSAYFFGATSLAVVAAASAGACVTEWGFATERRGLGSLLDGSALLTGVLLAMTLPPSIPLWMALLGGIVSISLGKLIWGGLGRNLFNPALVGRAFLQAAFPTVLTTWTAPGGGFWTVQPSTLAAPLMHSSADVVSAASPLGMAKFDKQVTEIGPLLFGNVAGSLGETSAILLVVVGVWLGLRKVFDWRLAVSTLVGVAAFSGVLHLLNPSYPSPEFMICSGGLLFAAVFMVTDPVTTPLTPRGAWIFGIGVGVLVVLIRLFGGLPEGAMYAVLLMNAVTPLIDRWTQPRRFGG